MSWPVAFVIAVGIITIGGITVALAFFSMFRKNPPWGK